MAEMVVEKPETLSVEQRALRRIIATVADRMGQRPEEVLNCDNLSKPIVQARRVGIYLHWYVVRCLMRETAALLGVTNATVTTAVAKVKERMEDEPDFRGLVVGLREALQGDDKLRSMIDRSWRGH